MSLDEWIEHPMGGRKIEMRQLRAEEIKALSNRPNVKKIAVDNFLSYLPPEAGLEGTLMNLAMDARSYGWNQATKNAIRDGVMIAWGVDR